MHTRRKFLVATAGAGAVALAGCTDDDDDDDDPETVNLEIGELQFDADALRNEGTTVTVPVTNPADEAFDVTVTLIVEDEDENELGSYSEDGELPADSTTDFDFEVGAYPEFAFLDVDVDPA